MTSLPLQTAFSDTATLQKPTACISQGDVNKSLFIGAHYALDEGQFKLRKGTTTVLVDNNQQGYTVGAIFQRHGHTHQLALNFERINKGSYLAFSNGTIDGEDVMSPKRAAELLLCLYRAVRTEVDPQWAADLALKTEARESAAQLLDTGMMPTIIYNEEMSRIEYTPPVSAKDKVCDKQCAKCAFRF